MWNYVDGSYIAEEDAHVHIHDLGLLRGYGVFDYLQVHDGCPVHLMDHLRRLQWSCEQVGLQLPMPIEQVRDTTFAFIEKNATANAGIRFVVTGGIAGMDLLLPNRDSNFLILHHPYVPTPDWHYSQGLRAITTNVLRFLPHVKTTNYMPAIFAMKIAKQKHFDDAIYLNAKNELLEGTRSNLFFFKNGSWITSDSHELVHGITKAILLPLAKKLHPIEYRSLHVSEISSCEEAFLCSSTKDVIPLVQIDDQKIGSGLPGPHTALLRSEFRNYIQTCISNHSKISQTSCL